MRPPERPGIAGSRFNIAVPPQPVSSRRTPRLAPTRRNEISPKVHLATRTPGFDGTRTPIAYEDDDAGNDVEGRGLTEAVVTPVVWRCQGESGSSLESLTSRIQNCLGQIAELIRRERGSSPRVDLIRVRSIPDDEIADVLVRGARVERGRGFDRANRQRRQVRR